ncbi:AraC family transcriptional regulator [Chryseobacterium indologenes]|uniref:helix-turn-helix domain-containing protein n=1 Tax=Chryseobacterium indologenes TaxID=253 RepID=UPI000F4FEBEE|nr:helix-turn-helix domain-containing protein [Chryseobacterium indologenes]AYZ35436.1 AraC family transcriptional regulator [Chryseobacterium indologenes]MBF6644187.1 AraC family transcriptional regulator [Chryseobacterium indologenes]MBU3047929.1 helix-turn-helix domain-containing protein [Chryseobacterium indologenes]MEB4763158.1 helix-turn-helix domain-containing protein [Chryseobacterium indologenes]QQQ72098.1 AraC family transcriptional regulator [Chryseobacterium indologenes]
MNTSELNSFIVILIYGSLVLLSLLKLANPLQVNKKANFWFGLFLFLWSTFWLDEILFLITGSAIEVHSLLPVRFVQYMTPIFFYFSVLFFTNPSFTFKLTDVKFLLLPLTFLICLWGIALGYEKPFEYLSIALILIQALFYTLLSYITIRKHQRKIQQFSSNTEGINLNWLEYIILVLLIVNIIYVLYNLFYDPKSLNFFINAVFLVVIYFVAYYSLKQKEIYPVEEQQRNELISIDADSDTEEVKRKLISDEELLKIKTQLENIMVLQEPYLDSELNLIKLAEMLSVSTHHLSYVINTGFNKNFFQYVNEFRVEYAKILLKTDSKLSILGIAYESGFNSKTSFNTTFKKVTGLTPSEFKK